MVDCSHVIGGSHVIGDGPGDMVYGRRKPMTLKRKPKLAQKQNYIQYAIVSVDKLIEVAERVVALEHEMRDVKKSMLTEGDVQTIAVEMVLPHISDYRDGKLIVRGMEEDGTMYKLHVQTIGEPEIDLEI